VPDEKDLMLVFANRDGPDVLRALQDEFNSNSGYQSRSHIVTSSRVPMTPHTSQLYTFNRVSANPRELMDIDGIEFSSGDYGGMNRIVYEVGIEEMSKNYRLYQSKGPECTVVIRYRPGWVERQVDGLRALLHF
jgi:hypothetical protein